MAQTPVTDDEIEEAVEAFKETSKKIEEEHGGAEGLSDDFKQIYEGEVPDPDSVKEVLNEIQHVIEREPAKYRKMMTAWNYNFKNWFENNEIILMGAASNNIKSFIDDHEVPDDHKYNMRRVIQQAHRSAAVRMCDEESHSKFYFISIVFRKPNKDW